MIRGMTGFGSCLMAAKDMKGFVETRSQNHRYLDIVYYLPAGFSSWEDHIRQIVNKEIKRGRIVISFKIVQKPAEKHLFRKEVMQDYIKQARVIQREFDIMNNLSLSDLVHLPGVVATEEREVPLSSLWPIFEKSLKKALTGLSSMRKREGQSIARDMSNVLRKMSFQLKAIKGQTKKIIAEQKKRLSQDEFLSFQKGADINEEVIRLDHYITEFRKLLKSPSTVGKKLDFIAQEMQREANTIGSKMQDQIISNAVITIKSKIEKLREQAQNAE